MRKVDGFLSSFLLPVLTCIMTVLNFKSRNFGLTMWLVFLTIAAFVLVMTREEMFWWNENIFMIGVITLFFSFSSSCHHSHRNYVSFSLWCAAPTVDFASWYIKTQFIIQKRRKNREIKKKTSSNSFIIDNAVKKELIVSSHLVAHVNWSFLPFVP